MTTADFKTKWQNGQSTNTVIIGTKRDDVVTKLKNLFKQKVAGLKKDEAFTDEEWNIKKYPTAALYMNNEKHSKMIDDVKYDTIKRLSAMAPDPKFYVGGNPTAEDVAQGAIGDCWFLAVLAAAADVPGVVNSVVVDYDDNHKIYAFVFWKEANDDSKRNLKNDKCWMGTLIDDYMFYSQAQGVDTRFLGLVLTFSKLIPGKGTWAPLLEKAFAKVNGDYETIKGGWGEALKSLGGIKESYRPHLISELKTDKDTFWKELYGATINKSRTIFICSRMEGRHVAKNHLDILGLVENHMYSVRRAVEFHAKRIVNKVQYNEIVRLIEVRNPWARTEWIDRWSDKSGDWNEYAKNGVVQIPIGSEIYNYSLVDDGSFFMRFDDFLNEFDKVFSCNYAK